MKLKRILELSGKAIGGSRVGFVTGHYHITGKQIKTLAEAINDTDPEKNSSVVGEYESAFAKIIGDGRGVSFAAGRMAFYAVMKMLDIGDGDEVILPGFTCSVMPNAVLRAGAKPVFADIDTGTLGSGADGIARKITKKTRLIVAQHSFGIPCDIKKIAELSRQSGIFLLEDCAIALDSSVDGVTVGNWGDAAMFSTDHSKPFNTLIGGFLYTRNNETYEKIKAFARAMPHLGAKHQKRLFGRFLFERKYYRPEMFQVTIMEHLLKAALIRFGWRDKLSTFLENDYSADVSAQLKSPYPYPAQMPPFLARLGTFEALNWPKFKERREKLLRLYLDAAEAAGLSSYLPKAYRDSSRRIVPLRFVFAAPNSESMYKKMSRRIDVGGTWFKSPVICCQGGPDIFGYAAGTCANSETVCRDIINWPCVVPEKWEEKVINIFKRVANG